jgi:DNA-directed RNA polymerase beta' subunit
MSLHYDDEEIQKFANITPEKRLSTILTLGKKQCVYGKCSVYNAQKDRIDITDEDKNPIPTLTLIDMLNKIDKEDLIKLGIMVYPASLYVFDTIPVPPIQIRPPDSLTGRPNKLTLALKNILTVIQISQQKCKKSYRRINYTLYKLKNLN